MAAWRAGRELRVAFEQRPSASGLGVSCRLLAPGGRFTVGGLEIEPVLVDRGPVRPAHGLVFRAGGRPVVISCDTRRSEALIAAGRGADLLVHEVFLRRDMLPVPGRRGPQTVAAVASYHTLSSEVGGIADAMRGGALALTHFVPPEFDRSALPAEVGARYGGPAFIGEDLMSFDLVRGEVGWREFRARWP